MVLESEKVFQRIQSSARSVYRDGALDLTFEAMGTRCRISVVSAPGQGKDFVGEVLNWVAEFESKYSRFLAGSLITRINEAAGLHWVEIDPETEQILNLCRELHFITSGILDPTALPLLRIWDWKRGIIPCENDIAAAMRKVGWRKVQREPGRIFLPEAGMGLDLGGMGKEYAVDHVMQMAIDCSLTSVLIDFGQDLRVMGQPSDKKPFWHVGLENPKKPASCWAGLGIHAAAVATSGDYVRRFQKDGRRYGHIIDPRSGKPVENGCLAVSVVAPNCTLAGALSTAAFVLGVPEGIQLLDRVYNAEGCIITENSKYPTRRFYEYVASENNQT